jgi:prepilin-type N-terminal cleavage/methylation domain-containing protein
MFRSTRAASDRGFTLLETLVALIVLVVGVLATATLAGRCMSTTRRSKYMSLAAELASEKLEDLNRWDTDDPQICVPTGSSSVGSLTQDAPLQTTTCPGGAFATVNYYDDVAMNTVLTGTNSPCPNTTYGCFSETMSTLTNGTTAYVTTVHAPSGQIQTQSTSTAPTVYTFDRRWVIEQDPVVNGVTITGARRVTVLVTLLDASVQPPVTFQMSMVRP